MDNRNRTENIGIVFENGIGKDWAFDVPDAFRSSVDIAYMKRAAKAANSRIRSNSPHCQIKGISEAGQLCCRRLKSTPRAGLVLPWEGGCQMTNDRATPQTRLRADLSPMVRPSLHSAFPYCATKHLVISRSTDSTATSVVKM